jgi:hypothetical protein
MKRTEGIKSLHNAKKDKKNEFYTQLEDIEKELKHYKHYFKNKIVYCNCDDPKISNFFHYFSYNFENLKLKKLITACYKNNEINLFSRSKSEKSIYLEYEGDKNGNKVPDLDEIGIKYFKGNGDFRNQESIELLKQSDIVVTNPPFTLFREYVDQLIKYKKKFLIIGNVNAITYKEIFQLMQEDKMWLGVSIKSGDREFGVPNDYPQNAAGFRTDEDGKKFIRVKGIRWYTNLEYKSRHEDLILYKKYNKLDYPKYDNYNAINLNITKDIPDNHRGIMGVPITFLDKYNPDQFEILGLSQKVGYGLKSNKFYNDYKEIRPDGSETGSSGQKTNGNPVMKGMPPKGNYYKKGKEIVHSKYARIFIRNKRLLKK